MESAGTNMLVFGFGFAVILIKAWADVGSVLTPSLFEQMLKHRNDAVCPGKGFYTYKAFLTAAQAFPAFGTTGDPATQKKELAAFFGQTSHETTGGGPNSADGPYAWGYCFVRQSAKDANCDPQRGPCAPGQLYYGRGPIQLTHNYNYDSAGKAIKEDLIHNPDLVATNPVISFKTAIWYWMTPQGNKPSCHDVMTNKWTPSAADTAAGRVPGYGVITNIINGGVECGQGPRNEVADRIGFYKTYCDILKVDYGPNLDCYNQQHF